MNIQISYRINNEDLLICDNIIYFTVHTNLNKSLLRFSQQNYDMTCSSYINGIILSIFVYVLLQKYRSFHLDYLIAELLSINDSARSYQSQHYEIQT